MIRTIPAGDLGLDVLLSGGFRLVTRLPGKTSATVLVRGGAGAGKTLMGFHAALELAKALDGDVAVGCVEILPTEYVAQIRGARSDVEEGRLATLPAAPTSASGPRVYCGLLAELDPEAPDLVASLEALGRDVEAAGGKPVVFIVDSLIEGYGIGASTPRAGADAVMKFAAQGGYGLVLCEETHDGEASPWVFAADTVIELGVEARERGRWIEVRKHRFGASASGRHELDLGGTKRPAAYPEPQAWVALDLRNVLRAHGWEISAQPKSSRLVWDDALRPQDKLERFEGAFAHIASEDAGLARSLAIGLLPEGPRPQRDLIILLDPLLLHGQGSVDSKLNLYHLPTVHGPARALRGLVERFALVFDHESKDTIPNVRRIIIGDVGLVLAAPLGIAWMNALQVFAGLVIDSGWGLPVIVYESSGPAAAGRASIVSVYADLQIRARSVSGISRASVTQRSHRRTLELEWNPSASHRALMGNLAHLDTLPRPRSSG